MIGSKRYRRIRHRAALALMAVLLPDHATEYVYQLAAHLLEYQSTDCGPWS